MENEPGLFFSSIFSWANSKPSQLALFNGFMYVSITWSNTCQTKSHYQYCIMPSKTTAHYRLVQFYDNCRFRKWRNSGRLQIPLGQSYLSLCFCMAIRSETSIHSILYPSKTQQLLRQVYCTIEGCIDYCWLWRDTKQGL